MTISTNLKKDDYRMQRARLKSLLNEIAPSARMEFHPDVPPTWIKFRIVDKGTGTILAVSSGDWHVTEIADKSDDWLRQFIRQLGGRRV